MNRATANDLCRRAGVADVPPGADPQEWLDDNDVFYDAAGAVEGEQQRVFAEVFSGRIARAEQDHERLREVLDRITDGLVHTTAFPYHRIDWQPLDSGLWGATSAAPNDLRRSGTSTATPSCTTSDRPFWTPAWKSGGTSNFRRATAWPPGT
jgi:hypothetical protein